MTVSFWLVQPQSTQPMPILLLREQASALTRDTNRLLRGEVRTIASGGHSLIISLSVVVPALDDFSYLICTYDQSVYAYPGEIHDDVNDATYTVCNEREFEQRLKEIFQSKRVVDAINSLLAQAAAASSN